LKQNIISLAAVLLTLLLFARYSWGHPWTAWEVAGVAIAVPSLVLFVAARLELGNSFSLRAKATKLVTTGIYARIRNPIYVFGGLLIAGAIIWAHRPRLLLIFAVLVPMQIYRSRKEEQVLTEEFGAAYLEYRRKTWF
jgi:protein-S-isoprenylcysteine O-methyltransferase Ste14